MFGFQHDRYSGKLHREFEKTGCTLVARGRTSPSTQNSENTTSSRTSHSSLRIEMKNDSDPELPLCSLLVVGLVEERDQLILPDLHGDNEQT